MQLLPSLLAACLELPTAKGESRVRLLHAPCGDGSLTAELRDATHLVAYGADPTPAQYQKAASRLDAAECTTPSSIRIHPHQSMQVLWLSPGTYPAAAALQSLATTLQPNGVLFLHLTVDQLTVALGNWLLTQTTEIQAFSLPGQALEQTRVLLARFTPSSQRTIQTAETYIEGLKQPLPVLTEATAPKYAVTVDHDSDLTPHLYSSFMDLDELHTLMTNSSLWRNPQVLAALQPTAAPIPRPLLPTKPGHLALQIAAGLLNGHEITYKERRLLIKGQTLKKTTTFTDEELDADGQPQVITRTTESFATAIRALDLQNGTLYDIQ